VLVEREIGNQPFQTVVFVLKLAQAAQLRDAQVAVLLLPDVEGGLADRICRQTSATGRPPSTSRNAYAICSSENFDFFIGPTPCGGRRSRTLL
jgi:hypothetical protein